MKGRNRFARVCDALVARGLRPQLIVSSPMLRCVQTADILARTLGDKSEVVQEEELLPGGDVKHLLSWMEQHASGLDKVAWVGHAPDLGHLAAALMGLDKGWINLKKGAIATLAFPESPELGRGELRWLVTAKILGL